MRPSDRPRVVILGSGPNRIGQGIEFDYCCVHASFALREAGYETVMINCNPETVSTDYDTSDRLYFEPLTAEDVHHVIAAETAAAGGVAPKVIVSLGGQTPLKLAGDIPAELVAGTAPASIDLAEDREKWNALLRRAAHPAAARRHRHRPRGGAAGRRRGRVTRCSSARATCSADGRCRSSTTRNQLAAALAELTGFGSLGREGGLSAERPVLIDRFLDDAVEVDVDAVRDHTGEVLIGGVMEHVEEAGVHSGDSALRDPAADARAVGGRGHRGLHRRDRRPPRRAGPDQRAVRGGGRPGLRHRGQPGRAVRFRSSPRPPACRWRRWRRG